MIIRILRKFVLLVFSELFINLVMIDNEYLYLYAGACLDTYTNFDVPNHIYVPIYCVCIYIYIYIFLQVLLKTM